MCGLGHWWVSGELVLSLGCSAYTSASHQVPFLVLTPVILCGNADLCISKILCKTVAAHPSCYC